ncbi:MAG: zinc ABC transporter ATP-binding protein ZnuC [Candidatus Puniceispirillum sp.]|nr:zinc ABC transporter ATP-binding protein ZnuC [Candidatus Pelagibacter sp.]MBA4283081.1 zinc ABC transporter ATP-binding protein ZnuC [Candidatus Puniceispirillum sp.]
MHTCAECVLIAQNLQYSDSSRNSLLVSNIDFEITKGTITTIIGPNGAGKSTLLKLILGILKPSGGSIIKTPELKIGYMPQKLALETSLPLRVKDFLNFFADHKDNTAHILKEAFEVFDIRPLLDKNVHNLSGGEWQRILFLRSIMNNPDLLILDEPAQCLDYNNQIHFYHFLKQYVMENQVTVIQVSHDLHLVWEDSNQIICMNKHICCKGSPDKVYRHEHFQSLFKGFAPYQHNHSHQNCDHHHNELHIEEVE